MSLAIAGAAAGAAALAAYVDAKFLVRNDIRVGSKKLTMLRLMYTLRKRIKADKLLIYDIFEERVRTPMGDHVFLIFEGRQWTYTEFYRALQPVGNWLLKDLDIQRGELVAVDGGNSPEYVLLWFALEAIGAVPAFLNCNLTAKPLVHSIKLCGARYVLADSDVRPLVSPVEEELSSAGIKTVYYNPELFQTFADTEPLPLSRRQNTDLESIANLMYTSGTTGLPKGVVIPRLRELIFALGIGNITHLRPGDRMYTCLPLYHATAHSLCTLSCIGIGATVVLSRKFSHRTFWPEIHASRATIVQYVGELCRYLVNAPPNPLDRGHAVRMAWGNGMRPDVWDRFRERFGIEIINELYGASDGMGFSTNPNRGDYSRNAIAVRGPLWHLLNGGGERRIRIDPDSQEVLRGPDGLAIEARTGEAGEMVNWMDPNTPEQGPPRYFGNEGAMVKRRIRDVFRKGDLWFRSGDLMRLDAEGRLFFVDRLGDTFRWRSENVSTSEVSDVVGSFPQVAEANVYGVLVPGADGRAGCAAVVLTEGTATEAEADGKGGAKTLDWTALADHCRANLPSYAVPIFIRVVKELEYTGTMKLQKGRLRSEGIQLDAIEKAAREKGEAVDAMFWLPRGAGGYVPFTEKDLRELQGGRARL
ncbi:Uu.00g115990.m01.CDS01 [Anthostomella pinea]|uniref:Uu.00g115990.m01.CDS01 n=1 Tax=Anthostomella pinea TaxID=933095 RepID=A0AAI8VFZ5_9PEZI|nr:Uu.00g115990.m01.CDS01 [Anthostomella pinea]